MGTTQTKETRRQTPAFRPKSSQHTTAQAAAAAGPQVQALANLQRMADTSPQIQASAGLQRMADTRATVQRRPDPAPVQRLEEDELQMKPIQRMEEDELQGKFIQRVEEEELQMKPIQRMEEDELQGKFIQRVEEEELLQGKALQRAGAPKANNTGLPDNLKSGIENLSGMSMDDVKVHRNSDKPAAVQAHAYAQGSDIHLGPGQEKHLPHEAWHVVQQAQGRVKPTMQMKGVAVNDDPGLETEADVMGAKALQMRAQESSAPEGLSLRDNIVQRTSWYWVSGKWIVDEQTDPVTAKPEKDGEFEYDYRDTGKAEEIEDTDESSEDDTGYTAAETLSNLTIIDWPGLTAVMDGYDLGTGAATISTKKWKKMRKNASEAITLADKSHPAHGSNFDQKQKPIQQIKDWAAPLSNPLRSKMADYFKSKYGVDLY